MQDDGLFEDAKKVQVLTPYRKLRKLRGWSLEEAAEQLRTSRHTLINIELGRQDAPKWLVRNMDREYNCGGQLIGYWLTKFSYGETPPTVIDKAVSFFRRWFYGSTDKSG
jgi:DNA-binding XRE family transcriptional regulator